MKHIKSLDRTDAMMMILRVWSAVCDDISSAYHCEVCVMSGGGLCDGPIVRPEECGVCECNLKTSTMRRPRHTRAVKP